MTLLDSGLAALSISPSADFFSSSQKKENYSGIFTGRHYEFAKMITAEDLNWIATLVTVLLLKKNNFKTVVEHNYNSISFI